MFASSAIHPAIERLGGDASGARTVDHVHVGLALVGDRHGSARSARHHFTPV
jgi:hypothetical protein